MQPPLGKSLLVGCSLIIVSCLLLIAIAFLWTTQPWLPYTEPDIQHALEVHYPNRNPRLSGFYDSNGDCRVAIVYIDAQNSGRVMYYVKLEKTDNVWHVISDESDGGLVPLAQCP
jgi:hypothetical protein